MRLILSKVFLWPQKRRIRSLVSTTLGSEHICMEQPGSNMTQSQLTHNIGAELVCGRIQSSQVCTTPGQEKKGEIAQP